MKNFLLIFFSLFSFPGLLAQDQPNLIFLEDDVVIGRIENEKVFVSDTEVLFSLRGNIIFNGDSYENEDILFTSNGSDIFARKLGYVYLEDGRQVAYTYRKGEYYLGDYSNNRYLEILLYFRLSDDGKFIAHSGIDDKILGWVSGADIKPLHLSIAAHMLVIHYELDQQVNQRIQDHNDKLNDLGEGVIGIIKPYWNDNPYYEWIWDGKTLRPSWGGRPEDEWKFDGRYIKPAWGFSAQDEWIWDGNVLKRFWSTDTKEQFIWDGTMLRPYWDTNRDLEWSFDGEVIKPYWGMDRNREWEVKGVIPLPLLAMVVMGFADR